MPALQPCSASHVSAGELRSAPPPLSALHSSPAALRTLLQINLRRWDAVKKLYAPRPYEQATRQRKKFDEMVARFPMDKLGNEIMPFCVGSSVLCGGRSQQGEIVKFASGAYAAKPGYAAAVGGCTVSFEAEGECVDVQYTSLGTGKGGARLRRPPPSLRPPSKAPPGFAFSDALKERVRGTYHTCLLYTSPSPRDS